MSSLLNSILEQKLLIELIILSDKWTGNLKLNQIFHFLDWKPQKIVQTEFPKHFPTDRQDVTGNVHAHHIPVSPSWSRKHTRSC